jgi:hypothetical protein
MRRLPPHWQEKDRAQPPPNERTFSPVKVWYVGRAAHAEAACNLLASRAERSATDPKTPWPEFAEYNCAACHHNLKTPHAAAANAKIPAEDQDWRKTKEYTFGRPLGTPPWQVIWPMTPTAGIKKPTLASAPLKTVITAMEAGRFKRAGIPEMAKKDAVEMNRLRKELQSLDDATVFQRVEALIPKQAPQLPEWDSAAQMYFALAALERARAGDHSDVLPDFRNALQALRTDAWPHVKWVRVNDSLNAIRKKRP